MNTHYDLVIIGGGPAGLSSALIAGRARRRVLLIDGGTPRNAAAPAIHSFLSLDGVLPRDFRALCHDELARYPSVDRRDDLVVAIDGEDGRFEVLLASGTKVVSKKIVLALGLVDTLPNIDGLADLWGRGVHACPFCDGYEHRDQAWGVLVEQADLLGQAQFLQGWTPDITVFSTLTDLSEDMVKDLSAVGVPIISTPIAKVIGKDGHSLQGVELRDGSFHALESLWIRPAQTQTALVKALGVHLREDGAVWRNDMGETSIPGIQAAGDCSAGMAQQAIFAAAEGARVTFPLIHALVLAG